MTGFVVLSLRAASGLEAVELAYFDWSIRRFAAEATPEPPIVLLMIDEADIRRFGHPVRDDLLQRVLERLLAHGPRAIGVDLYRDLPVPADREGGPAVDTPAYRALGELVRSDGRIIMVTKLPHGEEGGTPFPRFLTDHLQVGVVDMPTDAGGVLRHIPLYLWADDTPLLSLSLQLARLYLAVEGIEPGPESAASERLRLGETVIPAFDGDFGPFVGADDRGYQMLLDYRRGRHAFPTYSLRAVLDETTDLEPVRDRIVLVATASHSVKDSFATPLSPFASDEKTYAGIIHAHAADQLIRYARGQSVPISSPSSGTTAAFICIASLLGAALGSWNRALPLQVVGLGLWLAGLHLLGELAFAANLWLPVVAAAIASSLAAVAAEALRAGAERAEKRQIRGLFSRFQGEKVAQEIWLHRAQFMGERGRPESRRILITAMMSDLEGYTAAAEKMEPGALMDWVNEYMRGMAELIDDFGGVVDDYAGDGIKANFGFPVPRRSEAEVDADARAAVRCALAMGKRMESLNAGWLARDLPTGRCRIGLFTGLAVVGCIGGDRSLRMTSVGDTVNIAARLEGFGKEGFGLETGRPPWRILIGEETRRRIGDDFDVVDIGLHPLKGKDEPMRIYRVLGEV